MNTEHDEVDTIVAEVLRISREEGKLSGFCIGNTRKTNQTGLYFSPVRNTSRLVAGSAIIYDIAQAEYVARRVDGLVDYVLVDAEKKISTELYGANDVGNVERAVRETVKQSQVLTYKGNDLTVDSVESFIVQILSTYPRGLGGKKAAIIGVGNIGYKLALKLVERGMSVAVFRRDISKLETVVEALNMIKPAETIAKVYAARDALSAVHHAHLLVGTSAGNPVITSAMVDALDTDSVILDVGKGCCEIAAINRAQVLNIPIYRPDIRSGFDGHITMALESERIIKSGFGRATFDGIPVVSGGLLGRADEVVVDSIAAPRFTYGLANGLGDFVRSLTNEQERRLQTVHDYIFKLKKNRRTE
jgi:hypothetical protein